MAYDPSNDEKKEKYKEAKKRYYERETQENNDRKAKESKKVDAMTHSEGSTTNTIRQRRNKTQETLDQMGIDAHNRSGKYDSY